MLNNHFIARRSLPGCIATLALLAAALVGCAHTNQQAGVAQTALPLPVDSAAAAQTPSTLPAQPVIEATPTLFMLGPLVEAGLDLRAGPVEVPLALEIPALKVSAPVAGVGLTAKNVMDAPKGDIGDPIWSTAFWYRGGGIPGQVGTATIAGHVNDPLGRPEIFANLERLQPGDLIIVRLNLTSLQIEFRVDEVKVYSLQESSDPQVLTLIYGAGPVAGTEPQPAADGRAHLTLITCAGTILNGEFDHHTVVYATRSK